MTSRLFALGSPAIDRLLLASAICVVLVACSSSPDLGRAHDPGPPASPELAARYGQAAQPSPTGITYQPDVVVVGGGAGVVRSVTDDGLRWTLDGDAVGLSELDKGEVLFLTSRAAGRVVAKEASNGDVVLTLAPVQLHEIIRDGRLEFDSAIDPGKASYQEIPGMPGSVSVPDEKDAVVPAGFRVGRPRVIPAVYSTGGSAKGIPASTGELPPPVEHKRGVQVNLGQWSVSAASTQSGLALGLATSSLAQTSSRFKAGADITFGYEQLRLRGAVAVSGGRSAGPMTALVEGLEYIDASVYAGVGVGGSGNNKKVKIEIPFEIINNQVDVYGIPMVINVKARIFLTTALSGNNSTIEAHGRWGLTGALGVLGGVAVIPKYRVIKSMLGSIAGIAVGPSGVVYGAEMRWMLGVGIPGSAVGPYVKVRVSAGVANGSALGAALTRCTQSDLALTAGTGVGISLSTGDKVFNDRVLPGLPKKGGELEFEKLWTVSKSHQVRPDVGLCSALKDLTRR
jgi:hypothetical protein